MAEYQSMPVMTGTKPGMVQAIGVMTLVNGILNILAGLGLTFGFAVTVVGLLCVPFTILPTVLGIFEVIYASKVIANPPVPVKFSQAIAILEICCILVGNFVSMIVGILALVFYNDPQVKAYFSTLNPEPLEA